MVSTVSKMAVFETHSETIKIYFTVFFSEREFLVFPHCECEIYKNLFLFPEKYFVNLIYSRYEVEVLDVP